MTGSCFTVGSSGLRRALGGKKGETTSNASKVVVSSKSIDCDIKRLFFGGGVDAEKSICLLKIEGDEVPLGVPT
jgi:hypothetical protein